MEGDNNDIIWCSRDASTPYELTGRSGFMKLNTFFVPCDPYLDTQRVLMPRRYTKYRAYREEYLFDSIIILCCSWLYSRTHTSLCKPWREGMCARIKPRATEGIKAETVYISMLHLALFAHTYVLMTVSNHKGWISLNTLGSYFWTLFKSLYPSSLSYRILGELTRFAFPFFGAVA